MAAKSPIDAQTDVIDVSVLLKPKSGGSWKEMNGLYALLSVETHKDINRIPWAEVTILDGDTSEGNFEVSESKDFVPGTQIRITAGYHSKEETIYEGIITGHGLKVATGYSMLVLTCRDAAVKMTLTRNSKYFLKSKDSDIIGTLIGDHGLKKEVGSTKVKHKEIVQYHATDWDFMLARAEVNGMLVFVDDGKVTVKEPELTGSPKLVVTYGESVQHFDAHIDAESQLATVSCSAWDMKTQKLLKGNSKEPKAIKQGDLTGKKLSDALDISEYELHSTAPLEESSLKSWANAQLLKSRLARIRGTISFQGNATPKPGEVIELAGLGSRFNGDAYITGVSHQIDQGTWTTEVRFGLSPEWFVAKQSHQVHSPTAAALLPAIQGLQNGVVKKIHEDPDGEFRILVDVPVIAPTGDGIWARMSHFYATADAGCFFMPEVGDEVLLGFLNNDPRFPVILGMLYSSSKKKAPYTADDKNTFKAFVTKSQMKIEFEDVKKIIVIETPGGHRVTMSDDAKSILIEDSNKNKMEMSDKGISMNSPKDIKITAKGKLDLTSTGAMTLKSNADVKVEGLNVMHKAKVGFTGEGQAKAEVKASGQVMIKGAMVMIN